MFSYAKCALSSLPSPTGKTSILQLRENIAKVLSFYKHLLELNCIYRTSLFNGWQSFRHPILKAHGQSKRHLLCERASTGITWR